MFMARHWFPVLLEIGLFLFIIIHIIQGYVLEVQNRQRREIGYNVTMGTKEVNGIVSHGFAGNIDLFISNCSYR